MVVGGGRESDYSVCPRPLLQFLQFFQFMSDRLYQVTPGYIMLSQFTSEGRDVELNKKSLVVVGCLECDYSVCPCPLRRFYACITSDRMG